MNPFSFSFSLMKTDMLGENKGNPAAASCWHMHQQLPVTLWARRDTPEHPAAISPRQPSPVSWRAPAQKVWLGVCREWGAHNIGQGSTGVPVPRFCVQAFIPSVNKRLATNMTQRGPSNPHAARAPPSLWAHPASASQCSQSPTSPHSASASNQGSNVSPGVLSSLKVFFCFRTRSLLHAIQYFKICKMRCCYKPH